MPVVIWHSISTRAEILKAETVSWSSLIINKCSSNVCWGNEKFTHNMLSDSSFTLTTFYKVSEHCYCDNFTPDFARMCHASKEHSALPLGVCCESKHGISTQRVSGFSSEFPTLGAGCKAWHCSETLYHHLPGRAKFLLWQLHTVLGEIQWELVKDNQASPGIWTSARVGRNIQWHPTLHSLND